MVALDGRLPHVYVSLYGAAGKGIFAVSTYNTDYILTKAENFERALQILKERGYSIE